MTTRQKAEAAIAAIQNPQLREALLVVAAHTNWPTENEDSRTLTTWTINGTDENDPDECLVLGFAVS